MLLRTAKLNDSFVKARHNTEATPVNEGTKKSQPDRKKLVKKKRRENETSWRNVWNTMTDSTVNHKHYKRYTADYTWTTEQQETNRFGQETDQENELRNDKKTVSEFSTTAQKKWITAVQVEQQIDWKRSPTNWWRNLTKVKPKNR